MITVKGIRDLKDCTAPFAYVENYDKVYQNVGGEWVEKKYFLRIISKGNDSEKL